MMIKNLLWIWIVLWAVLVFVFIIKELIRHFYVDPKIKKDDTLSKDNQDNKLKNSKKNINDLIGLDKKTFLTLTANMVIIALAFLSFTETSKQNNETALINKKTLQMFELENRPYVSLNPAKFEESGEYIKIEGNNTEMVLTIRFVLKNTGHLPARGLSLTSVTIPSIGFGKVNSNVKQKFGPIQASFPPKIKSSLGSGEETHFNSVFIISGMGVDGKETQFDLKANLDNFKNGISSIPVEATFSYSSDLDQSLKYETSLSAIISSKEASILSQY